MSSRQTKAMPAIFIYLVEFKGVSSRMFWMGSNDVWGGSNSVLGGAKLAK